MDVKYGGKSLASSANAVSTLGPVKAFLLTVVRHGETHSNKEGIVAGQTDAPLSVVGVSQAARLGERFANEKFTHWLTSDLSRAKDTAQVVMAANLHAVGLPLKIDARLRERDFGEAEGMTWTELKNLARSRNIKFSEYDPPNGESLACFRSRVTCFFNSLCRTMLAAPGPCPTLYVSGAEPVNRLHCGDLDLDFGAGSSEAKNPMPDEDPELSVIAFTHGGFARELCIFFQTDLGCEFGSRHAGSPVGNTGVSRFLIKTAADLKTGGLFACAKCLMLRDVSHLN